jgi:membrane-associated phospholipid phosphatase
MRFARVQRTVVTTVVAVLSLVSTASGQTQTADPVSVETVDSDEVPSVGRVFMGTLTNFARLPTRTTAGWLIAAAVGAAATHPADSPTTRTLAGNDALHEPLEPGAVVGSTPFALGTAIATYGIGRAANNRRVARLGADLIQAQLMAETLAFGVKQAVRRARPEGSGFSFPSGHTTVTFASADVLRRTFGWKIGVPAYAVASYVAASRIQSRHHYLSDVVFGAALGTIAGRTVTVSRSQRLAIIPVASADRAVIAFSLQPRATTSSRVAPSRR